MKALTLHQPWASAIAWGVKRIETRGWATSYRGPIAIHAGKRWTRDEVAKGRSLLATLRASPLGEVPETLPELCPLGVVVAVAVLVDCREMDGAWIDEQTDMELEWGGWAPGRFGWVLENVHALARTYEMRGRQGLWNVSEPDAVEIMRRMIRVPA